MIAINVEPYVAAAIVILLFWWAVSTGMSVKAIHGKGDEPGCLTMVIVSALSGVWLWAIFAVVSAIK